MFTNEVEEPTRQPHLVLVNDEENKQSSVEEMEKDEDNNQLVESDNNGSWMDIEGPDRSDRSKSSHVKKGKRDINVWNNFIKCDGKLICKWCTKNVSNKVERLRSHMKSCQKFKNVSVPRSVSASFSSSSSYSRHQDSSMSFSSFEDKIDEDEKNKIDQLFAKFLFTNNLIPFG
jgi:hypothetical protein